jgi:ribosome-binding protein aMBF1 (putative translation factor)
MPLQESIVHISQGTAMARVALRPANMFARLLAEAREDAGLSRAAVARHMRRTTTWVTRIENGTSTATMREFIRLARLYGLDPVKESRRLLLINIQQRQARRSKRRRSF